MLPSPTEQEINSPEFSAIWQLLKKWDISTHLDSNGKRYYTGGNGSHVKMILDALKPVLRQNKIDSILNEPS
jgi:hypothetical protein